MPKRSRLDPKSDALKEHGTLNTAPERITDPLFVENDFFDPRDLLQVKYEMLRRVRIEGQTLTEAARALGVSRPSFYKAQAAFEEGGLAGLLPRRRGPRQAHKLTEEVMTFVENAIAEDETVRAPALARLVEEEFGIAVHPRSIERALARHQKKR